MDFCDQDSSDQQSENEQDIQDIRFNEDKTKQQEQTQFKAQLNNQTQQERSLHQQKDAEKMIIPQNNQQQQSDARQQQSNSMLNQENQVQDLETNTKQQENTNPLESSLKSHSQEERLKQQLEDGLAKLEIHVNSLPQEIEEKKIQIQQLEKKGKVSSAQDRKKSLENLEVLQSVFNQLEKLKKPVEAEDSQIDLFAKKEQELKEGLAKLEINDVTQLQEEISEKKQLIQSLEKKGQQNKANERRKSLEKLEHLHSIFQELESMKSTSSQSSENQIKKEQLEIQLKNGLAELEIQDAAQLQEEISEKKTLIQSLEKKGQQNKANDRRKSLEKLEHLHSIFQELENMKSSSPDSENQIKKEQLEIQLKNGLAELEIQDAAQLHEEISEKKTLIQSLEKKGQQNKANVRRKSLEKLEHLHSIFQELENMKSSLPSSQISESQIKKQQLELQLKTWFTELEIENATQLEEEIEERKQQIKNYEKKGQMNKVNERKNSLERLEHLLSVHNELEKLQLLSAVSEIQAKKTQLELELNNGLAELEIQDVSKLQEEIKERKDLISNFEKKGQQNKAAERKKSLEKLEHLQNIFQQLASIDKQSCSQNQNQREELEKELRTCLQNLEISDVSQLLEEISDIKNQIDNLEKKGQANKASKMREQLEKLEYALSIQNKLVNLTKSNEVSNSLDSNDQNQAPQEGLNNGQTNSSNQVSSKIDFKLLQKNISKLPICSEKCLLQLIDSAIQQFSNTQSQDSDNNQAASKGEIILHQFKSLNDRLKIEDLISQEVNEFLQKIEINIKSENLEQVIQESEKLLKKLRPLSVQEMKRLIKKANEAAELIKGQDILLFLGGTGAGKSTTIHFLAGSKMVEIETQVTAGKFLKYIGPDPNHIKNKALQKIKIGHQAESETRYITPVLVNFSDIGMTNEGSIVLCDAPGFGDTAGPEVDIANGIGIVEAIKRCKSVRPVILVSSLSIGDKGEGIKKLAHVLVGLVSRISDKLGSFSYLFTKYPVETNIHVQLVNIKKSVNQNQEESSDKAFVSLFDDMIEKTEDEVKRIDPLKDKPSKVIKSLINTSPILNPEGVFQFSITESSKGVIQEQVRLHQLCIISAAKRSEYRLIEYKLDDLKFLIDNLNQDFIKQAYSECVNFIVEGLNKSYSETIAQFNRCIANENKLTVEDLRQYKSLISQLQEAENLRKTHLGTNVIQTSSLIQNLIQTVETISKEFNQQTVYNISFKNNLDNIKLLADEFPEIKPKHMLLCQVIQANISNIVSSYQQILITNDFNKLAEVLSQIKQYSVLFKNHLNEEQILQEYKKGGESLLSYLNQICSNVDSVLKKQILNEKDIEELKTAISLIESAKETIELKEHIKMDEIKKVNENLIKKILGYFENIHNKIDESFKNEPETAFKDIEIQVQQMGLIRKIEGLDSKTSEMYHKTIQGIQGYMQQMRRDTEQLLSNFQNQKENINFSKIYRCLTGLKNAQWMNNVKSGTYDDIMKNITEDLVKHSQKLHEKLLDIDLDLNHPENIQQALHAVTELDALRPFEQTITELSQYRENAIKRFKSAIQNIFDFIQDSFNLQNKAVYQQKLNLKQLESIKSEYEEFNPERIYLREQGYQTIESLNEEIIMKENEKNDSSKQIESEREECEQFLSKLNETALNFQQLSTSKLEQQGGVFKKMNQKIKSTFQGNQQENSPTYKLLKEVNCSSISEVYEQIGLQEKAFEKLQDSVYFEKILKEIQKLQSIQAEYSRIQKSKTTSQQGEEFLRSKNYPNIKNLDSEITRQRQIIQNSEQKDQEYVFTKLEGSVAEKAFLYLEACKKIRWVKEDANTTYLKLSNYLTKYGDFIQQEMSTNYQKVIDATLKEINEVVGSAQRLASFLQEICELEKQKTIFELIKGKDTIQNWRNLLTNYFIQVSDDMSQITIDKSDLRIKISVVKALSQIDFLIGESKFFTLYRQYQNSLSNEFKEIYRRILELIEKNDFKLVSAELLEIDENPMNDRAIGQIKHNINSQVMDLVEQAKTKTIMLGNNLDISTIQNIVDNLNKIESAKKHLGFFSSQNKEKSKTEGYLDETNLQIIEKEQKGIQSLIIKKITRYLESIEALIIVSDFYEAEVMKEYINQVFHLLGRYGENSELTLKLENLQSKLEGMVGDLLEEYENMEFQDYILRPPKQILDKLQKVSGKSIKYTEFLNKMKQKIVEKVRKILKEIKEATPTERNQLIQRVETALCSIPDELRILLQNEFENCKKLINQKEAGYQDDFERAVSSGDLKVLSNFMEKCKQDQMFSFQSQLQKDIIKQVQECKDKVKELLNDNSIKQALNLAKKLQDYKENFGKVILDIDYTSTEVQTMIINKLNKLIKYLKNISNVENSEQYEKEYDIFLVFVEFKNEVNYSKILLGDGFDSQIEQIFSKLSEYFIENQEKFNQGLENYNIQALNDSLSVIKKWNQLLKKIKTDPEIYEIKDKSPLKPLADIIEKCQFHPQAIKQTDQVLKSLRSEILSFEFFQGYAEKRNEFYHKFEKKLKALQQANDIKDNLLDAEFDVKSYQTECIPLLQEKTQKAEQGSVQLIERDDQLSKKDFDVFNLYYDNLVSLEENVKTTDIQPKKNIEVIEQQLKTKLNQLQQQMIDADVNDVYNNLIKLKVFSDNIPSFKCEIDQKIDESLKIYMNKNKSDGGQTFGRLVTLLESEESGVGLTIISEHKCFKGQSISIFNSQTQKHDIDYILKNIEGVELDKKRLNQHYQEVKTIYDNLIKQNIVKFEKKSHTQEQIIEDLVSQIKLIPSGIKTKKNKINWEQQVRDKIPSMVAHIFALWTLLNMEYFNEMKESKERKNFLLQPHAGQIISILRLLGIGYGKSQNAIISLFTDMETADELQNNLIQIGTGEGKSVTLAVASSIFALFGVDVSCACYSEYLSNRDYNDFLPIFNHLGITQYIKYGPFNKICEYIINERGDIRELVIDFITNQNEGKKNKHISLRPRVLLIDEVDVFFNKDFYGNVYNPLARLRDPTIGPLTDLIWQNRAKTLTLKQLQLEPAYKNCMDKFKGWEFIIDEALKDMVSDSKNFIHDYIVLNDKIAYKEQDGISFDVNYGYKTLFAYYKEHEDGKISKNSLDESTFIGVRCGSFSYAQIPYMFEFIVGVTGTLKTLSEPEKHIVEQEYKVTKNTFIPSVFGGNKRIFAKKDDIFVENTENYFKRLRETIDNKMKRDRFNRAILVFFETKQKLMEFYNSPELAPILGNVQVLTEEVSTIKEKNFFIKRATTSQQITLLTKPFGRGTDFVCRDQQVLSNGGVHIIQAFFSNELSEEIQIQGRCARQGEDGSYNMVLLDEDLEKFLGTNFRKDLEEMRSTNTFYQCLDKKRNEIASQEFKSNKEFIDVVDKEHKFGQQFIENIHSNNIEHIRKFLGERNKGNNDVFIEIQQSRILCLVDATSSMGQLLNQAKNTVSTMFQRACQILKDNSIPEDSFQLQFAVYRDYDMKIEGVLQYSPWESKPDNLRKFLEKIQPAGGGDYEEAIEIGLQHANSENEIQPISQIILIADAPAKTKNQIKSYRQQYGSESYWGKSKFKQITYYKDEIEKLKRLKIPVHSFYLNNGAKANFQEIANTTGGRCENLNMSSSKSSEILTNIVTEQILQSVGQASGKGNHLVDEYKKLFSKSYV